MTTTTHHLIAKDLYLVRVEATKNAKPTFAPEPPIHHVVVIDCSGSMSYDLPKIREQLKKRLPKILKEKDVITLIWFSAKGQHGVLLEAEPVPTLKDLQDVNKAIDRWLKPIGLTGFKEPLEDAQQMAARAQKQELKSHVASLLFMSDGCDNQWDRASILKTVDDIAKAGTFASATFVEYGYYADRPLLAKMAERAGGSLIFAEDFSRWEPTFEAAVSRRTSGAKRVERKIEGDPIGGFAFALHDGDLLTFETSSGKIAVPEDVLEVAYLSPRAVGQAGNTVNEDAEKLSVPPARGLAPGLGPVYAALSLFSIRMKPEIIFPILKALGDVKFIEQFSACFGKQRYSAFMDAAKEAAFEWKHRFEQGRDPSRVPSDDAYTILDLLRDIQEDDGNRVLLNHSEFKYSKISRGRVDPDGDDALKFVADDAPDGYSISSLTWNEDRPNVSFLVRKEGYVDLDKRLNLGGSCIDRNLSKIPTRFPTWIFRNYALVKDGLVNVEILPVRLTKETIGKLLNTEGGLYLKNMAGAGDVWLLDLKKLPIINRQMVKSVSAKKLFEDAYELTQRRAAQKVYNTYRKEKFPKESKGYAVLYGEKAAGWLKEQGLTDYNGFSPKLVQAAVSDKYFGKELSVSLKGLSALPSVKEAKEKISNGKVNAGARLMEPHIIQVENFLKSSVYAKAKDKDKVFAAWLDSEGKDAIKSVRSLLGEMARTKFAIVIGQVWFQEFASLDENSMEISGIDGNKLQCSVSMNEIEIEI